MEKENRTWGFFTILQESENYKVKELVIKPFQCISLQRHNHRNEHWFCISGKGYVNVNKKYTFIQAGESIDIPVKSLHQIYNADIQEKTDLVLIEIQTGESFEEEDIERFNVVQMKEVNHYFSQ